MTASTDSVVANLSGSATVGWRLQRHQTSLPETGDDCPLPEYKSLPNTARQGETGEHNPVLSPQMLKES